MDFDGFLIFVGWMIVIIARVALIGILAGLLLTAIRTINRF